MFVLKILALGLLIGVSSVFGEDPENVQGSSYKLNHPPQSDTYQSIPVAIVYDEPEKSIKKYAEGTVTTYHPRIRNLETVTDPSRYEEESSTTVEESDPVKEEMQVKKLKTLLRKARLRLRTRIGEDDPSENIQSVQKASGDGIVTSTGTSNDVYQDFEQNRQRQTTVELISQTETPTAIDTVETTTTGLQNTVISYESTLQNQSSEPVSTQQENQGNQRNQRVRTNTHRKASSSVFTEETAMDISTVKQTSRKPSHGRGSIKYRSYVDEQAITKTQKVSTNKPSTNSGKDKEENYSKAQSNINKLKLVDVTTSRYPENPERENYPSSEQPKLTNNRPGPNRVKPQKQHDDELTSNNTIEQSNKSWQNQRRGQSYPNSIRNTIKKDSQVKLSSTYEPTKPTEEYPKLPIDPLQLKPNERKTTVPPSIATTTEEENYPKLPIVPLRQQKQPEKYPSTLSKTTEEANYSELPIEPLQVKPNERKTTVQPFIATTTEEENYPKLPIVPIRQHQQQLTTNELKSTAFSGTTTTSPPFTATEEENYPKLPLVPIKQQQLENVYRQAIVTTMTAKEIYPTVSTVPIPQQKTQFKFNEKEANLPTTTVKEDNYPVVQRLNATERPLYTTPLLKTTEASTVQNLVTTTGVNYLRTKFNQEGITNAQIDYTRQAGDSFSTQASLQKSKQEEDQSEISVPRDVDGTVITLKSSFDVATLSPIAKSVLQNNKKAKVIYRVQKAETFDVTNEPQIQQTSSEEIVSTTENIPPTVNAESKENEIKPKQGSTRRQQNQNEFKIPVVIVYDNTDTSVPVNQRKILRTKINPVNNDEQVSEVKVQKLPKAGNVTANVNAESRARSRKPVVPIVESENHVYAQSGKFNYR